MILGYVSPGEANDRRGEFLPKTSNIEIDGSGWSRVLGDDEVVGGCRDDDSPFPVEDRSQR